MKPIKTAAMLALALTGSSIWAADAPATSSLLFADPSWLSPTSELDNQLPSWLQFSGEDRARGEGEVGLKLKPNATDRYLLNRFRLDSKIRPAKWLKFEFQTQDARAFWREEQPNKPPYQDTWDLRLAYVEVGDLETYHADFRMGRQELAFGDERLIGISNWTNVTRTFDGYRATFQDGRYRLDAFAASVVVLEDGQIGQHTPGNYLEGLYGEIRNPVPNSTLQPYFLWRRAPSQTMEDGGIGTEDFGTTGFRWVGKLPLGFDYNSETAIQRGSLSTDRVRAWASHQMIGYKLPSIYGHAIHYIAEYNFASGDKNPKDGIIGTFNQLYPSGHDKLDLADLVGWQNIRNVRTGPEIAVSKKLSWSFKYNDYWLASASDALYNSSGAVVARSANGSAGTWVGQEFDSTATYSVSKISQLGAGFGYLLPGTFLERTTPGHSYTFPYLFYNTSF